MVILDIIDKHIDSILELIAKEEIKMTLLGSEEPIIPSHPPLDSWKCPFTCELMVNPVIADDKFTYEEMNIKDWIQSYTSVGEIPVSPITGQQMSEITKPNRALQDSIIEYLESPYKTMHEISTDSIITSKIMNSFQFVTNFRFEDSQVDIKELKQSFIWTEPVLQSWWPMIHNKDQFINAVWQTCSSFRNVIYTEFSEFTRISESSNEPIMKCLSRLYFLQSMYKNTYKTKSEQLIDALTQYTNRRKFSTPEIKTEIIRYLYDYTHNIPSRWIIFWGERPQ